MYSFNPKVNQKGTTVEVTPCPSPRKAKEESEQLNLELAVYQLMKKPTREEGKGRRKWAIDLQKIQSRSAMKLLQQMSTKTSK